MFKTKEFIINILILVIVDIIVNFPNLLEMTRDFVMVDGMDIIIISYLHNNKKI